MTNVRDGSDELIPLVIVQGFLGTPGLVSWDHHIHSFGHDSGLAQRKIIVPNLGAVSSLHDRACELYYSLVGGRVDYGLEHSTMHQHACYGRTFAEGLYPAWSKSKRLHFVGHSVGGPTIVKLQHLMQQGHFGPDAHPDMIFSVNAVCAPFRGTQLVYTLGESPTSAPAVRPLSIGAFLAKFVHVLAYLSPLLPSVFDVHADARSLSYLDSSPLEFIKQLWRSEWAESKDAAPYDMTFEAAEDRESAIELELELGSRVHPHTFYRSHVCIMTGKTDANPKSYHHTPHYSSSITHNVLYIFSKAIGSFDYNLLQPLPSFAQVRSPEEISKELQPDKELERGNLGVLQVQGEEYWANDGIVPVFSQWHPHPCATKCHHEILGLKSFEESSENSRMSLDVIPHPGQWVVMTVNDANHFSLIPGILKVNTYQKAFWTELGHWLDTVDSSGEPGIILK